MTETLHIFAQDILPEESWRLLQWCLGKEADEFSLNVLGFQETIDQAIKLFDHRFDEFRLNTAPRRTLTSLTGRDWIRPIELWRLNKDTIVRLQEILPEGIFTYEIGDTWYEDLYVYRGAELMMGIVTHEQEGILRVTAEEKQELNQLGIKYRLEGEWVGY